VTRLLKETEGRWNADPKTTEQFFLDDSEEPLRYAVAYDPEIVRQARGKREERLTKADRFIVSVSPSSVKWKSSGSLAFCSLMNSSRK